MNCCKCGKTIDTIDIGAHRKFIDKCASEYMCRDCLAEYLGWSREMVDHWVLKFRKNGCLLFPPLDKEN